MDETITWVEYQKDWPPKEGDYLVFIRRIKDGEMITEVTHTSFYSNGKHYERLSEQWIILFYAPMPKGPKV